MLITKARVENFKSFHDSNEFDLRPGFNVVVGQNNVGKTALLDALSMAAGNNPHRSLQTSPSPSVVLYPRSTFHYSLNLSQNDLIEYLRNSQQVFFVKPNEDGVTRADVKQSVFDMLANGLVFRFTTVLNEGIQDIRSDRWLWPPAITSGTLGLSGKYDPQNCTVEFSTNDFINFGAIGTSPFPNSLTSFVQSKIYFFRAERYNLGDTSRDPNGGILTNNSSNLGGVLDDLQSNVARFRRFNSLVSSVLPDVKWISVKPSGSNARILVWSHDPETEREDLASSLAECGTGVGQVLSILYLVMNSRSPQVLMIDEPQSFLHPGAARRLFEIMASYRQHQYILTTHSPGLITSDIVKNLVFISRYPSQSTASIVRNISSENRDELQLLLFEVGVRLTDVYGADNVLWVEGPTEEICFPIILHSLSQGNLLGTTILGVVNTGDLETKRSDLVFELYDRLSGSQYLMPPTIGFIFDRENRTELAMTDLTRRSRGKLRFLNRMMYENYLLNPDAVAEVLNGLDDFSTTNVTTPIVANIFKGCGVDYSQPETLRDVHGANVLKHVFSKLSSTNYQFDKKVHGRALTEWIVANSPHDFNELLELLTGVLTDGRRELSNVTLTSAGEATQT